MQKPSLPINEKQRLEALYSYQLFDGVGQSDFNAIVKLASKICDTPISLITLVTPDKQIFTAKVGLEADETDRNVAFCAHAILSPNEPLVVPNAKEDDRFRNNPLVTGDPNIVFYTGIPLTTRDGFGLGTLCVIDTKKRELTADQLDSLDILSKQVVRLFELRKVTLSLERKDEAMVNSVKQLNMFATKVSHDMKTAFRNMVVTTEVLKNKHANTLDKESIDKIAVVQDVANEAMVFLNTMDKFTKTISEYNTEYSLVSIQKLLEYVKAEEPEFKGTFLNVESMPELYHSPVVLRHIFSNLIHSIALKSTAESPEICFSYKLENQFTIFQIEDNGTEDYKFGGKVFYPFTNNESTNKLLINNTGIELALVKHLTELAGGEIHHSSNDKGGTTYHLSLPIIR